jgi:hypothetical protein
MKQTFTRFGGSNKLRDLTLLGHTPSEIDPSRTSSRTPPTAQAQRDRERAAVVAKPSQSKAPEPVGAAFSSVWGKGATSISHLTVRPRARAPGFTSAVGGGAVTGRVGEKERWCSRDGGGVG